MQRPREHSFLACFSQLAQLAFLHSLGTPTRGGTYLLFKTISHRFDHRPILWRHFLYFDCFSSPVYLGLCQDDTKYSQYSSNTEKQKGHHTDGCPHSPLQLTRHTVFCLCLENTLTNQLSSHKIISKSDKLKNTLQHILKIIHIL